MRRLSARRTASNGVDACRRRSTAASSARLRTTHSGWLARSPERYEAAFAALSKRATLVRPGACAGCDRFLTLLLERDVALDPLPAPRCGLFVQRTALVS